MSSLLKQVTGRQRLEIRDGLNENPALRGSDRLCLCVFCCCLHEKAMTLQDLLHHSVLQGALGSHNEITSLQQLRSVLQERDLFKTVCLGHLDLLLRGSSLDYMTAVASASIFVPMQDWRKA